MSAIQEAPRLNVYPEGASTPIPMPFSHDQGDLSHDIAVSSRERITEGAAVGTLIVALNGAPAVAQEGQIVNTGLPHGAIGLRMDTPRYDGSTVVLDRTIFLQ